MNNTTVYLLILMLCKVTGFLLDNPQSALGATPSPHDDFHDLVELLVEEKTLRHRLEQDVTTLSSHVSALETAFTELYHNVEQTSQNKNKTTDQTTQIIQLEKKVSSLENDVTSLKTDRTLLLHTIDELSKQQSETNHSLAEFKNDNQNISNKLANITNNELLTDYQISFINQNVAGLSHDTKQLSASVSNVIHQQFSINQTLHDIWSKYNNVNAIVGLAVHRNNESIGLNQTLTQLSHDSQNISSILNRLVNQQLILNQTVISLVQDDKSKWDNLTQMANHSTSVNHLLQNQSGHGYFFTATNPSSSGVFQTTLTNIGNAYDSTTGMFTCKQTGVYFVTLNLIVNTSNPKDILCWIGVNGSRLVVVDTRSKDGNLESSTNSIFVHLSTNDSITLTDPYCTGMQHAHQLSSFSVGLIYPD